MAALINALDNNTPYKLGENGHSEYTWSNNIRERIIQLSFQLTRTKDTYNLALTVDSILLKLECDFVAKIIPKEVFVEYMSIMFRLVGQTRDVISGKGEYTLSYMLLSVWQKHYPALASFAFQLFVLGDGHAHPYGSWKDIKYMIDFMENQALSGTDTNSLTNYAVELLNNQLRVDIGKEDPSLAAKWVPRE